MIRVSVGKLPSLIKIHLKIRVRERLTTYFVRILFVYKVVYIPIGLLSSYLSMSYSSLLCPVLSHKDNIIFKISGINTGVQVWSVRLSGGCTRNQLSTEKLFHVPGKIKTFYFKILRTSRIQKEVRRDKFKGELEHFEFYQW